MAGEPGAVFIMPSGWLCCLVAEKHIRYISRSVPMNVDVTCSSEYPVSKVVLASYLILESQGELNY